MRNTSWFILAIGSALIWGHTASFAQEAPRPPVQVVIGPGGVKVIDPKTGKEVPSVVTKIPNAPPRFIIEFELDQNPGPDKKALDGLKAIEEAARNFKDKKEAGKKPGTLEDHILRVLEFQQGKDGPKQMEFKIVPGPDGKAILVFMQKKAEPLSTDKKIDLLLKQVGELRSDVDGIKKKLDASRPPRTEGPDKKLDKETLDRAKEYMELLRKHMEEETKKAGKGPERKAANPDAEIERRLERILREAEELRREIRNLQTPPKKK